MKLEVLFIMMFLLERADGLSNLGIFVDSSHGSNELHDGKSQEAPLKTLAAAKEMVMMHSEKHPKAQIAVFVAAGEYFLNETLVFTRKDSPKYGRVKWISLGGGATLSGGFKINTNPVAATSTKLPNEQVFARALGMKLKPGLKKKKKAMGFIGVSLEHMCEKACNNSDTCASFVWSSSKTCVLFEEIPLYSASEKSEDKYSVIGIKKTVKRVSNVREHVNGMLYWGDHRMHNARTPNYDDDNPLIDGNGYQGTTGPIMRTEEEIKSEIWPATPEWGIHYQKVDSSSKIPWSQVNNNITIDVFPWGAESWGNLVFSDCKCDEAKETLAFGSGGWQINSYQLPRLGTTLNNQARFYVSGVLEEMDVPNEWWYNAAKRELFLILPLNHEDISKYPLIASRLESLLVFDSGAHDISFEGFNIKHTSPTVMKPYHAPSRGDWSIYRGGAIIVKGHSHHIHFDSIIASKLGGNAVFLDGSCWEISILNSNFYDIGDSAVAVVGYRETSLGTYKNFPRNITIRNNIMLELGQIGKQVAGIFVSNTFNVTIEHNDIRNVPRAAIVINDGLSGGHKIKENFVTGTVRETGDHGPLNLWGRERHWCALWNHYGARAPVHHLSGDAEQDTVSRIEIVGNYFATGRLSRASYSIDVDDGSSNLYISGNVCEGGSLKIRDGDLRQVEGNLIIDASMELQMLHPMNDDRIDRNVVISKLTAPISVVHNKDIVLPGGSFEENCLQSAEHANFAHFYGYDDPSVHAILPTQKAVGKPEFDLMLSQSIDGSSIQQHSHTILTTDVMLDRETLEISPQSKCADMLPNIAPKSWGRTLNPLSSTSSTSSSSSSTTTLQYLTPPLPSHIPYLTSLSSSFSNWTVVPFHDFELQSSLGFINRALTLSSTEKYALEMSVRRKHKKENEDRDETDTFEEHRCVIRHVDSNSCLSPTIIAGNALVIIKPCDQADRGIYWRYLEETKQFTLFDMTALGRFLCLSVDFSRGEHNERLRHADGLYLFPCQNDDDKSQQWDYNKQTNHICSSHNKKLCLK